MSWLRERYGRNPWWIPPDLLGRVPESVEPRVLSLLGFVSFALFFEQYDLSLLNNALKYIRADFAIPETGLGFFQMWIRLGSLPALALIPLADRLGRRRLFLASVIGMSIGTLITAFCQSPLQFIAAQMLTRSFILTASAVSTVIVIEEFPADARGWGIGMLAAIAAVGHGAGALVFSAVEILPFGWRALYALGFAPLLLLPLFRSGIAETERFRREQRTRGEEQTHLLRDWVEPLRGLLRSRPERALGMAAVAYTCAIGHAVVINFTGYFVLEYHGWEPIYLTLMVIGGGAFGIVGNVVAGRMADRVGRRRVGVLFLCSFPLVAWIFFHAPSWLLVPVWALLVFIFMGGNVVIRALASELFPTSHRGTSTGLLFLLETVGAATGFGLLGTQQQQAGDLAFWIPLLSNGALLSGLIMLALPETGRRELEEISAEPEAPEIRARIAPETTPDTPGAGQRSGG
jgi:MFS family permease